MNRGLTGEVSGTEVEPGSVVAEAVQPVRVLKFGGTSLASLERFESVVRRVREVLEEPCRVVVVVSAVGGTTDSLDVAARHAAQGKVPPPGRAERSVGVEGIGANGNGAPASDRPLHTLAASEEVHLRLLELLAAEEELAALRAQVRELFRDIEDLVHGVRLLGECTPRTRDRLLSHGELLSSLLVSAGLRARGIPSAPVDARGIIRTDARFGSATVDMEVTTRQIRQVLPGEDAVPVVTGFLASSGQGETTTLGRGASDLTATLIGAALEADAVEIWTDVGGIHTADPRSVPLAEPLEEISYDELLELANFGAKVMCPLAVEPVRDAGIPVRILSTLDPSLPGTRVVARTGIRSGPVRGISAIRGCALLRIEGVARVGVSEGAERLYRALGTADVRPLLFTQDSSAHSLSVAVPGEARAAAVAAVRREFERERRDGLLGEPFAQEDRSVLALVGEGMRDTPGISGLLFSTLGRAGVNVHAIAQGSSERNISWVVADKDAERALQAVHDAFLSFSEREGEAPAGERTVRSNRGTPSHLMPGRIAEGRSDRSDVRGEVWRPRETERTVRIAVLGVGGVGSAFLDQLAEHGIPELERRGFRPILNVVARSSRAVVRGEGIDPGAWREALERSTEGVLDGSEAVATAGPAGVLVDCTASAAVASGYAEVLRGGGAVVTANKLALAGDFQTYRLLKQAAKGGGGLHHEATVGAGLPLLRALRDLQASGDRLIRLDGVLSGSLSFIFQRVNGGVAFSEAVREAAAGGLTEPHPGEDLGLNDVVRKLVILARETGRSLEPEEVDVTPLLDGRLLGIRDGEAFLQALEEADDRIEELRRKAHAEDARLMPVALLDGAGARVGLQGVPADGPLAGLRPGDNLVRMQTLRYRDQPLVIQGPGAGTAVTAAGLMVDLYAAADRMVTRMVER